MFVHKAVALGGCALALVIAMAGAAPAVAAEANATTPVVKPARPTGLRAKGISTSEARLTWADNAVDEWEYHVEWRSSTAGWTDMGAIPPNVTYLVVSSLVSGKTYFFRVRAKNGAGWSPYSNESAAVPTYTHPPSCVESDTVMCLRDGRYRVEATYERTGTENRGIGRAVDLSQETGIFWFFSPSNVEAIVKVLDGCALNRHHWVFTTGLTDLRVLLQVVDTRTGEAAAYLSEGGGVFTPIQDTDALSCD
jgi:hypothetical protein